MINLLAQLKQPSTFRGLALILALVGVKISPQMTDSIAAATVAVLGLIEIVRNERK